MMGGKGFRCPNCAKLLAVRLESPSNVSFSCPRCKAFISIHMKEPVPWAQKVNSLKKKEEKAQVLATT